MANSTDSLKTIGACRSPWKTRRDGLTLVEVLAALVILGGSVTAMLVSQSNSLEHLQTCRQQLVARQIASELITDWRLTGEDLAIAVSGEVDGLDGWSWRRRAQERQMAVGVTLLEITLEVIYSPLGERRTLWVRSYRWLVENGTKADTT